MAAIGFTAYDTPEVVPQPTTAELLAALAPQQRLDILNGFAAKVMPQELRSQIFVDPAIILFLYKRIDAVEEFCRPLLRGELVDTPEVVDPETGEVTTPATYVTPPASVAALKAAVDGEFSEEFSAGESAAVVDKMIAYSKADGTGDAAFYLSKVMA